MNSTTTRIFCFFRVELHCCYSATCVNFGVFDYWVYIFCSFFVFVNLLWWKKLFLANTKNVFFKLVQWWKWQSGQKKTFCFFEKYYALLYGSVVDKHKLFLSSNLRNSLIHFHQTLYISQKWWKSHQIASEGELTPLNPCLRICFLFSNISLRGYLILTLKP